MRGGVDSPVTVETTVRGDREPPIPDQLPAVTFHVGNDLHPLDVTEDADAIWLRALVVPDQTDRHARLAAAIDLVREDPPTLVAGDALDAVEDLAVRAPDDAALCTYSTLTLYQFDDEEIATLRSRLAALSRYRPVHWLSGGPHADRDHPTHRHVRFVDGSATETRLVEYESYGSWLRWLGDHPER